MMSGFLVSDDSNGAKECAGNARRPMISFSALTEQLVPVVLYKPILGKKSRTHRSKKGRLFPKTSCNRSPSHPPVPETTSPSLFRWQVCKGRILNTPLPPHSMRADRSKSLWVSAWCKAIKVVIEHRHNRYPYMDQA